MGARKTVILKITILRHLSDRVGNINEKNDVESKDLASFFFISKSLKLRRFAMKRLLSCEFNMDTACVELKYSDGSMISINCTAVEDEVANSRFQRSELDWLIYNDPLSYAELILNGDPEKYLRTVTEIPQLDSD